MLMIFAISILTLCGLAGNALAGSVNGLAGPVNALQDPAAVVRQVDTFLRSQASTYPGSVQITVDASRLGEQARCDDIQVFLPSGLRLRSRLSIGVRCMAAASWVAYVQASLSIDGFYYVASHAIKPGVTLTLDDVTAREGDLLTLSQNIVFDPSQIIDRITTQTIRAGMPIRANALRSPDSIQRGQTVRLIARGTGFVATGEGEAMQSGAPGAQIRVRTRSGQIVSGAILNANTVQILM